MLISKHLNCIFSISNCNSWFCSRSLDIELNSTETLPIDLAKGYSVDDSQPLLALDTLASIFVSLTNASFDRVQVLSARKEDTNAVSVALTSLGNAYDDLLR